MDRRNALRKLLRLSGTAALSLPLLPLLPANLAAAAANSGRRLILLELAGANDGLNTVVPYRDERYHQLRPTIGLKDKDVIKTGDDFALHAALKAMMPVWEAGNLAVVHGLGYPLPNRSHFKSIALWETGSDGRESRYNGWLTHDIEHAYSSAQIDAHGIALGQTNGTGLGVFTSTGGNWLSMSSASQYVGRNLPLSIPERQKNDNPTLSLLMDRATVLEASLQRISQKMERSKHRAKIPGSQFSEQMSHAVNIINAGIDSPVIKLTLGGFDTHENQTGRHRRQLKMAAVAIKGLYRELSKTGEWDNTVLISYSEFGRRPAENTSGGTDHGTAAPHFICGGGIKGGFYGHAPDLGKLFDDDLQFTMDYRSVYHWALKNWLQLPASQFENYYDQRLDGLIA